MAGWWELFVPHAELYPIGGAVESVSTAREAGSPLARRQILSRALSTRKKRRICAALFSSFVVGYGAEAPC